MIANKKLIKISAANKIFINAVVSQIFRLAVLDYYLITYTCDASTGNNVYNIT